MSKQNDALKLALEALENSKPREAWFGSEPHDLAITAIKDALSSPNGEAQPAVALEQRSVSEHLEPVAWMHPSGGVLQRLFSGLERSTYTIPLYTTPPQQSANARKPLTDEQIDAAVKAWFGNEIVAGRQPFAKRMRAAIEAAHGIKE